MAHMEPEEILNEKKRRKDRLLANMKFIGALFLRELLAVKVMGNVVGDLLDMHDGPPEEHKIECAVELLKSIGHTLDQRRDGKQLMSSFIARLMDLKDTFVVLG